MDSDYDITPGRRVKLIELRGEQPDMMPEGLEGTLRFRDDAGNFHIDWDNGSQLSLLPRQDRYEWLPEEDEFED